MKRLLKKIYSFLPFKKPVFSLLKRTFKPSQRLYQHLHFKGFFKVEAAPGRSFEIYHHGAIEENEIFWNGLLGGWEKKTISLWVQLAPHSDVILDIGANTGIYTLVAQTLNPAAEVHCFEPIPGVVRLLERNIHRNHFPSRIHPIGLSNYTGEAKIYLAKGTDFAYSVTVNKNFLQQEADELTIAVKTLSDVIEEERIDRIGLMKIDVESHEAEVLEGMGHYLKAFRPTIFIEVLDEEMGRKLTAIFAGMNYLYFNINDETGTIRQTEVITKSDYWNYLLCRESVARDLGLI